MTAGVLICCRCDFSILPNERPAKHVHDRPTGAPLVEFSHADGCSPYPPRVALRSAASGAG
jgi:hypothetical protein